MTGILCSPVGAQAIVDSETPLLLDPSSNITITMRHLDPAEKYWVTIVPEGAEAGAFGDWQYLPAGTEATIAYPPRDPGRYEIRLHSNEPGYRQYTMRDLVVSRSDDGRGENSRFAAMTGLWSNGEGIDYFFDGREMTLLTRADANRGPGTIMFRLDSASGAHVTGQWLNSGLQFAPVTATLDGDTLTLTMGPWTWSLSHVSSESRSEVAARYPDAGLPAGDLADTAADGARDTTPDPAADAASDTETAAGTSGDMDAGASDAGTDPALVLDGLAGVWKSEGHRFYFDGARLTLLSDTMRRAPPGSIVMTVESGNAQRFEAIWKVPTAIRDARPVTATRRGSGYLIEDRGLKWMLTRETDESPLEAQARFPDVSIPAAREAAEKARADAEARAAIDAESLAERHPEVFAELEKLAAGDKAARELVSEMAELLLTVGHFVSVSDYAADFGLTPETFEKMITNDPAGFYTHFGNDMAKSVAISVMAEYLGTALADGIFARTPYRDLPRGWKVPLHAALAASFEEGVGILAAGTNPTPLALVGPVLNRILDLVEIHEATRALAATQETGLYQVALGAELTARLLTRYPGTRSDAVAEQWRAETLVGLPDMVGPDDADAVARIVDLGEAALAAALNGKTAAAADEVRQMVAIGKQADGPFLLSAEGPTDLLVKLASGGDAPSRAVKAFLTATALGDVVRSERIAEAVVNLPPGPWGETPAVRDAIGTLMTEFGPRTTPDCAAAYGPVPKSLWKPLFAGHRLTLRDDRGRESTRVATLGLVEGDRFCLGSQVQCAMGAPDLTYCASGEALFLSGRTRIVDLEPLPDDLGGDRIRATAWDDRNLTPAAPGTDCAPRMSWPGMTAVRWDGTCEGNRATGDGLLQAMQGPKVAWQMRVGRRWGAVIENGDLWYDLDLTRVRFDLTACDPSSYNDYRAVRVTLPPGIDEAFFWNTWLVAELRQRAANVATRLCPNDSGFSNIAISIRLHDQPDARMAWGRNYSEDTLDWREGGNRPANALSHTLENQERARQAAERRRAEAARAAELAAELDSRRAVLVARGEAMIADRKGSLEDLALALEIDELGALEALERGVELEIGAPRSISSGEVDGRSVYLGSYRVGSAFAALEAEFRQRQDFSWENWIDQTQASRGDRLDLTCRFSRLRDIPEDPVTVRAELQDFASDGSARRISVSCR